MTDTSPPSRPKYPTERESRLEHVENTINRSGPEVVAALNRSLPYFEDLFRARGPFKDICIRPEFERGWAMYLTGTGDPAIEAMKDRRAHSLALATAKIVKSDEEYAKSSEDNRALQLVSMDRQKALGHSAVPRDPVPLLTRRMTVEALTALVHGAVEGLLDPGQVMIEKVPGSLKKLTAFRIVLPAGSLLQVIFVIQFESRKVWASAVALTRPDMLSAPLLSLTSAVDPANEFAWPREMPTETRIACCLRALALFAAQIARQSDTGPPAASDAP
jgi:hypothetical protein